MFFKLVKVHLLVSELYIHDVLTLVACLFVDVYTERVIFKFYIKIILQPVQSDLRFLQKYIESPTNTRYTI